MFVGELPEMEKSQLEGIGEIAPGVELMRLVGVDRGSLSDFDRVEVLKARARLRAHLDAELLADMVGILDAEMGRLGADLDWGDVHDVAAAEIGAPLCWTRRASERQLGLASSLLSDFRQVWEMLRAGLIDLPRARVIVEHTLHLEDEVRDRVVAIARRRHRSRRQGCWRPGSAAWHSGSPPPTPRSGTRKAWKNDGWCRRPILTGPPTSVGTSYPPRDPWLPPDGSIGSPSS